MNKNARMPMQNNNGGGMSAPSPLAPAPPPLSANGPSSIFPIQNSPAPSAPASSGLADLRNSGPGTLPAAYGTSPQDIVNSAYGPKVASDRAGAGSAYGDLIAASGDPGVVPRQPGANGASPALAPPRPSGIDRMVSTV